MLWPTAAWNNHWSSQHIGQDAFLCNWTRAVINSNSSAQYILGRITFNMSSLWYPVLKILTITNKHEKGSSSHLQHWKFLQVSVLKTIPIFLQGRPKTSAYLHCELFLSNIETLTCKWNANSWVWDSKDYISIPRDITNTFIHQQDRRRDS